MNNADLENLMNLLRRIDASLAEIAANTGRPVHTLRVGDVEMSCNCPEVGASGDCPFHDPWGGGVHPEGMVP